MAWTATEKLMPLARLTAEAMGFREQCLADRRKAAEARKKLLHWRHPSSADRLAPTPWRALLSRFRV